MLEEFSTNATVAKVRAIYGTRLKENDYNELLSRGSVAEVADYLKRNTHYSQILSAIDTNTIHRGYLEALLRRYAFEIYTRICKFQQLNKQEFYNYKVSQMEIGEIVSCILHLNAGASEAYISSIPGYFVKYASFDLMELSQSRKYSDVLQVLRKTSYYAVIKDERPDRDGHYNCSVIETKLRKYYLQRFDEVITRDFSGKTADDLHYLINTQVDLINIINSFRMKVFNGASGKTIASNALPFYGRLSKKKQQDLFDTPNIESYVGKLSKTYYGRQMMEFNENLDTKYIETAATALRSKYAGLTLRSSQTAPVSLYTVLYLLDIEIENITNIIEGIRYQAPIPFIEKLLIY